ncbi:hypothetical protein BHU72_06415 [Desulfuribacillus stibiiarsenatis]|uniref:GGDEF domain-containing protein n=1 Tax=Desulfuribacillus stibiiarsenatis TaxID=1390249 RepID=A0A1E5L594_9FIRM|nr:GGDEF domain-containing protein [Desulfuribacillus stibiiarsenatis]OEH85234.1 hypothetical protein BHU72_06415 [Desulfuribacillus stibiiarsenatis]
MKDIHQGRTMVLEELFFGIKLMVYIIGLFFIKYIALEDKANYDALAYVISAALIICLSEGFLYVYQTQIKPLESYKPKLYFYLLDGIIITIVYLLTNNTHVNMFPIFIAFVVIGILRFPHIHFSGIVILTIFLYFIGITIEDKNSIFAIQVGINITILFLFALTIATVIKEIDKLVKQVAFVQQELEMKNNYLKEISQKDQMTDLFNHYTFFGELHKYRSISSNLSDFCLAILDIDNFKKVNDTYGHIAGDLILTEVARTIKELIRKTDIAARYGGEEFGIIFPALTLKEGVAICERIRKEIESKEFHIQDITVKITISCGISSNHQYKELEDSAFVNEVDSLLYQAKRTGKNKVVYDSIANNQWGVNFDDAIIHA